MKQASIRERLERSTALRANVKKAYIYVFLALIVAVFSVVKLGQVEFFGRGHFLNPDSVINMFRISVPILTLGGAFTLLMISGYIDLSVGSAISLSAVVYALMIRSGFGMPLSVALAIVLAAATQVLVERYVRLLMRGIPVGEVVALTYTEKAASALRRKIADRVSGALLAAGDRGEAARLESIRDALPAAFIGTIHAFCARVLREYPVEAGVDAAFVATTSVGDSRADSTRRKSSTRLPPATAAGGMARLGCAAGRQRWAGHSGRMLR